MFKYITLPVLLVAFSAAPAQTMKIPVTAKEKAELMKMEKELFGLGPSFTYNLSLADPLASYTQMNDRKNYDAAYLQQQTDALQKDPGNPVILNNIAGYYNFYGQADSSMLYYGKAYDHISIGAFNGDSAMLLSFRGLLKSNLGLENPLDDIRHALKINPNDSIAIVFYPLFLIGNKEFSEAKDICVKALESDSVDPVYPYVFLIMTEVYETVMDKMAKANTDEKLKAAYAKEDISQLAPFSLVNKYAARFKNKTTVRNARYMADVLAFTAKLVFVSEYKNGKQSFNYPPGDKQKIQQLVNVFSSPSMKNELNPYTIQKNLGYLYLMLQNNTKSAASFKEAIRIFPDNKGDEYFNPIECYDGLVAQYYLFNDTASMRKALLDKINAKPMGKETVTDYILLAKQYYQTDDLVKAEEWINRAKAMSPKNFDVLQLLAHLSYLKGKTVMSDYYAKEASKNVQLNEHNYRILMQYAIYFLVAGNAATAYQNIEVARKAMKEDGSDCELCDKLIGKYIKVGN